MKRKGIHKKIIIPAEDLELSSSQLAKKYGVSRITAWRVRSGRQNFILQRIDPKTENPNILTSEKEFWRIVTSLYKKYFGVIPFEDVKDIVANRRLFILENQKYFAQKSAQNKNYYALLYYYADKDMLNKYTKPKKFQPYDNEITYSRIC